MIGKSEILISLDENANLTGRVNLKKNIFL